jgi:hypothetical protein
MLPAARSGVGIVVLFRGSVFPVAIVAASGFTYHPDQDGNGDDNDDYQDE